MKERIMNGWTFMRVFYTLIGLAIIAESIRSGQWPGIAFGAYFTAMGVFRFGCAAGNCYTNVAPGRRRLKEQIEYTEINNSSRQ